MKLNEPGRHKLGKQISQQQAKRVKLYSDIPQRKKNEHVTALGSQRYRGLLFLHPWHLAMGFTRRISNREIVLALSNFPERSS